MKNPLHYQLTEYDCGPTSMLNAISYLFEREEIVPEVVRNIMLYCLDCASAEGLPGMSGTSRAAMMFLSNWLDGLGRTGRMSISSRYLSGARVCVSSEGAICDALRCGGVAVVRLFDETEHYVLFTGVAGDCIQLFDPYYQVEPFREPDIQIVNDHPFAYNRIVPFRYFNRDTYETYALGKRDTREAVLLFNGRTTLTDENTIEYFI